MIEMDPSEEDVLDWVLEFAVWLTNSAKFGQYEQYLNCASKGNGDREWQLVIQQAVLDLDYPDNLPAIQKLKIHHLARTWNDRQALLSRR
tara:strand:- start:12 stop:281 length:270 start_codon:yes stop_codon:yes gene_type:complete